MKTKEEMENLVSEGIIAWLNGDLYMSAKHSPSNCFHDGFLAGYSAAKSRIEEFALGSADVSYCSDVKDSLIKLQEAESRIEELQKKLDIAVDELLRLRQFCVWLSVDSFKYKGTDAGNEARFKLVDVDKCLAKIRGEK